ncbi:MAG: TetR family transcriptional regulator C-terminal domain-containing protein [Pseudomonadota bacterium]
MNKVSELEKQPSKPAQKTSRRTESKEVRRQQLIDATIESIAQHGIAGTTMSTVTETAGLSLGIVNFHFESKQKLFEETLVYVAREYHQHCVRAYEDVGPFAREKLTALVDAHFHPDVCTHKKLAVWYAFYGEGRRRAIYRDLIDHIDDHHWDIATELCQDIIEHGGYSCPPAKQVARTLEALLDGIALNILMYPESYTPADGRKQAHTYLAAMFPKHFDMPDF